MYLKYRERLQILERTNLYNVRKINRIFIAIESPNLSIGFYFNKKEKAHPKMHSSILRFSRYLIFSLIMNPFHNDTIISH